MTSAGIEQATFRFVAQPSRSPDYKTTGIIQELVPSCRYHKRPVVKLMADLESSRMCRLPKKASFTKYHRRGSVLLLQMNKKLKRREPSCFLRLHGVRGRETAKKKYMKPGQQETGMKETWKIDNQIRESPRTETVKGKQTKRERERAKEIQ